MEKKIVFILVSFCLLSCIRVNDAQSEICISSCPDITQWHHWTAILRSDYYMIQQRDEQDSLIRHIVFCPSYKNSFYERVIVGKIISKRHRGEYCEVDLGSQHFSNHWLPMKECSEDLWEKMAFLDDCLPERVEENEGVLYVTTIQENKYAYTYMQMDTKCWIPLGNSWYVYKKDAPDSPYNELVKQ